MCKCFFPFHFIFFSLCRVFQFDVVSLFFFFFAVFTFVAMLLCHIQKNIAKANVKELCPYVFFRRFMVSVPMFKSLNHFKLIFCDIRQGCNFIRLQLLVFPTPIKETILFPFWALDSVPLIYVSFSCQCHTVLITIALKRNLKSRSVMPPGLFFFLMTALAIQDLLIPHTFQNCFLFPVKNDIGVLIGNALNLYMALDSMNILT